MPFPKFLRVASVPFVQTLKINATTSVEQEVHDFYEFLLAEIISQKLGFAYLTVTPEDQQWGSPRHDGEWSGMVGMLLRNEADLIIGSLSVTEERSKVIDYSYPYYTDRMVFATVNLEKSLDEDSFLKPFTIEVWISLCLVILILPAVRFVLLQRKMSYGHLKEAFVYAFRKSKNVPQSASESLFKVSSLFFQTLVCWFYAAVLLSFLTFPNLSGVRNIAELAEAVRQGTHECTAYPGAYYAEELMDSADPNLKVIGRSLKENKGFADFVAVLSSKVLSKIPAYLATESHFVAVRGKFFVSEDGLFPDYLAVGMRKDFCCKTELDLAMHDIWASGIYVELMKNFRRREFYEKLWKPSDIGEGNKHMRLSLVDMYGIFILLVAGHSLATLIFFIELLVWILRKNGNFLIKEFL